MSTSMLDATAVTPGASRAGAGAGAGAGATAVATAAGRSHPVARPRPTGAWLPGDEPGHRQFADLGTLRTEGGRTLDVTLAYETWGTLAADGSNAVLVEHALTGDSHVRGPAGPGHPTSGWWESLVGPGCPIDTDRWFVVAPNVLGGCQGSTGPSSPAPDGRAWGSRFPALTMRDQVEAEAALADVLGVARWSLVIGGSMGGMRALEWAIGRPERVERLALIATGAQATAEQIAWSTVQCAAIRGSAGFCGGDYYALAVEDGPGEALGLARRIAHTTYRTAEELQHRFGNRRQEADPRGRFQVTSYLDHHAQRLVDRFDANSYLVLSQAMDSHDAGRGRGGVQAALGSVRAQTLVVAIDSDRLFPVPLSAQIAEGVPAAELRVLSSPIGHDGFLVPSEELAEWISDLLRLRVRADAASR